MAEYLISQGKKIIIVGCTESTLRTAATEMGHDTTYYVLDTGDIASIPSFIETVIRDHPDVDCLVNNTCVQRPFEVNDFDLTKGDQEIAINITGPMHLAIGFLPHFKSKSNGAVIMNVTSILGYIPTSIITPVYNGTKAFGHFWSMNLRTQLARDQSSVHIRVVEIVPPTVATDLHRERSDPDDNKKEKNPHALSVEEFMDYLKQGWEEGREVVGAGWGRRS
ncbi:hypothetical protein MMC14_006190 [Varicellaria rhodocarpa]|nr:hypothetical protein [Varicellaria rhodocarpa]